MHFEDMKYNNSMQTHSRWLMLYALLFRRSGSNTKHTHRTAEAATESKRNMTDSYLFYNNPVPAVLHKATSLSFEMLRLDGWTIGVYLNVCCAVRVCVCVIRAIIAFMRGYF